MAIGMWVCKGSWCNDIASGMCGRRIACCGKSDIYSMKSGMHGKLVLQKSTWPVQVILLKHIQHVTSTSHSMCHSAWPEAQDLQLFFTQHTELVKLLL